MGLLYSPVTWDGWFVSWCSIVIIGLAIRGSSGHIWFCFKKHFKDCSHECFTDGFLGFVIIRFSLYWHATFASISTSILQPTNQLTPSPGRKVLPHQQPWYILSLPWSIPSPVEVLFVQQPSWSSSLADGRELVSRMELTIAISKGDVCPKEGITPVIPCFFILWPFDGIGTLNPVGSGGFGGGVSLVLAFSRCLRFTGV